MLNHMVLESLLACWMQKYAKHRTSSCQERKSTKFLQVSVYASWTRVVTGQSSCRQQEATLIKRHWLQDRGGAVVRQESPGCCSLITGLLLRIWLKQGKEKRLLARILKFLEKARKRQSRQNSTIKVRKCERKKTWILQKAHLLQEL